MRGLPWYAARLKAMPPAEIAYRLGLSFRRRARRLAAGGVTDRQPEVGAGAPIPRHIIRFFDIELPYPGPAPIDWSRDYKNGVSAPKTFYGDIDYRDPSQAGDSKYIWELNRHQFLIPWALEYRRTGVEGQASAVTRLILDWISENPRYVGVNWISSLELALRILSWGISLDLASASEHVQRARAKVAASVGEQATFIRHTLSLHSSANNHLMGELVGLLAAGAFFPEVPRCGAYARFARGRICREALKQNFSDGVNREQAIYYHHYTLEYVLTAMALFGRLGWETPEEVRALARRMLEFVDQMTDDHGHAFEIGDSDDGTVTGLNLGAGVGVYESLLWSGFLLYGDESFGGHAARIARSRLAGEGRQDATGDASPDPRSLYWHGGVPRPAPKAEARVARRVFPEGGYFISTDVEYTVIFRAGPFGYPSIAAHAHCDQLSVGLKRGSTTLLTDCGTYVYHTEDRWRRFFRGTAAHNTVGVDGADQAEYAGPFLWSTHANGRLQILADGPDGFDVRGSHDGYLRLADPVQHERTLTYRRGAGYRIVDRLRGRRPHVYHLYWNLGQGVSLRPFPARGGEGTPARWLVQLEGQPILGLVITADSDLTIQAYCGDESIPAGFESRRYLEKRPIVHLRLQAAAPTCEFRTCILTPEGPATEGAVRAAAERWS